MVCFMTLSWQMAGAESSRTWGTKRENTDGPRTVNPEANKSPSPQAPPPAGHTTHSAQQRGPNLLSGCQRTVGSLSRNSQSLGVFLHLEAAAGEVIVLDAIEIPTQAAYPLLGDK